MPKSTLVFTCTNELFGKASVQLLLCSSLWQRSPRGPLASASELTCTLVSSGLNIDIQYHNIFKRTCPSSLPIGHSSVHGDSSSSEHPGRSSPRASFGLHGLLTPEDLRYIVGSTLFLIWINGVLSFLLAREREIIWFVKLFHRQSCKPPKQLYYNHTCLSDHRVIIHPFVTCRVCTYL